MHTFGADDMGFPTFEIRRNGTTVKEHTGELEVTALCLPGGWNVFARKAP
ncbi:MAG: hypothetical protein JRI23_12265 [Deltaproteobacteria bacterium]|jgi:hypothetical protein|nr:hypothetical protein [Deltaproteobacteria bacterium]MBW2532486.1 hypothetical protein [Deltaproteobacteria bacterium]